MLFTMNTLNTRVQNLEEKVNDIQVNNASISNRLDVLEYQSINLEARSRRLNLLFRGIPETTLGNENSQTLVKSFIRDSLELANADDIIIQRAHRLGNPLKVAHNKPRPIIVCFLNQSDLETVLSNSYKLKGKNHLSINRDFPKEIVQARSRLWDRFKREKTNNPGKSVKMVFPAKLLVGGKVVQDEFPDWNKILYEGRVKPLISQDSVRTSDISSNKVKVPNNQGGNEYSPLRHNKFNVLSEIQIDMDTQEEVEPGREPIEEEDNYSQAMTNWENRQITATSNSSVSPRSETGQEY